MNNTSLCGFVAKLILAFASVLIGLLLSIGCKPSKFILPSSSVLPLTVTNPDELNFGEHQEGKMIEFDISITNTSDEFQSVRSIHAGCECANVLPSNFDIRPGMSQIVRIIILPEYLVNNSSKLKVIHISGIAQDGYTPLFEIQVAGLIKPTIWTECDQIYTTNFSAFGGKIESLPLQVKSTGADCKIIATSSGGHFETTANMADKNTWRIWTHSYTKQPNESDWIRVTALDVNGKTLASRKIGLNNSLRTGFIAIPALHNFGAVPIGKSETIVVSILDLLSSGNGVLNISRYESTGNVVIKSTDDPFRFKLIMTIGQGEQTGKAIFLVKSGDRYERVSVELMAYGFSN